VGFRYHRDHREAGPIGRLAQRDATLPAAACPVSSDVMPQRGNWSSLMKKVADVITEERTLIAHRRDVAFPRAAGAKWQPADVTDDLVGLALSGGGIRSAMFNLGLLQALHANGLLRYVDYLSTVSGGSY